MRLFGKKITESCLLNLSRVTVDWNIREIRLSQLKVETLEKYDQC